MLIATRILHLRLGEKISDVVVSVFAPIRSSNGVWICRYEIDWPQEKRIMTAGGVDGIQAVLSALQMIGSELYCSKYHREGKLYSDFAGGGFGFPVPSGIRDLLEGDDKKLF